MRNVRKVMLLAVAAMAVTAFAASSASALTVTKEAGGAACGTASMSGTGVSGGCLVHATSEAAGVVLKKHVFGVESTITTCNNEFWGRVGTTGTGFILEQVLSGAGCARQPCKAASGEAQPWGASSTETGAAQEGGEFLTTNFCVEPIPGGTDETCEIDIPFNETATLHRYEFGHAVEMPGHGISGFKCELVGHWNSETGGTHDGASEVNVEVGHV
jgi:hypothetical protein